MFLLALYPHLQKLGSALEAGAAAYGAAKAAGVPLNVNTVTVGVAEHLKDWDPVVKGKHLLDPETKQAGIRFLAGIAFNLSK